MIRSGFPRYSLLFVLCLSLFTFSLRAQDDGPPQIARIGRGVIHALEWSPDGATLAVASPSGVWLLDDTLSVIGPLVSREMNSLAWHPAGTRIAISSTAAEDCLTQVRDAASRDRLLLARVCGDQLVWNPAGDRLAVIQSASREVHLLDIASEATERIPLPGQRVVWSADGTQLALSATDSLFLWDIASGQTAWARVQPGYGEALRWDADGILIACHELSEARNLSSLCRIDPATGAEISRETFIFRHPGERSDMRDLHLNAAGDHFSFVLTNQPAGALPNLHIYRAADRSSFITAGNLAAWHDDRVTVAAENGSLTTLDTTTGEALHSSIVFTGPVAAVAWSPGGERLASAGYGDAAYTRIWGADPLEPEQALNPQAPAQHVRWHGDRLAAWGTLVRDGLGTSAFHLWSTDGTLIDSQRDALPVEDAPVVAWSHDFERTATGTAGTVTIDEDTLTTAAPLVRAVAWSADDARVATLSAAEDERLLVVEVWEDGERLSTAVLSGVKEYYPGVFWGGDLLHIVARTDAYDAYAVFVYEAATGLLRLRYDTPQYYWPKTSYNDDDSVLAVETLTAIVFVDTVTGQPFPAQIPESYVNDIDWYGDRLAVGGANGLIRVYDVSGIGGQ